MTTIDKDEAMTRVMVADATGNVYAFPTGPDHNAAIAAGIAPTGFELVMPLGGCNPKYAHMLAASMLMFQMIEQAKVIFEAHSEELQNVGTPHLMQLGILFENMAANLNLVQRQAIEGGQAINAQSQNNTK